MIMRKLLSQRLFGLSKTASQGLINNRVSSSSLTRIHQDSREATIDPKPGDLRRFSMIEKIREMGMKKDRILLDGLSPPVKSTAEKEEERKMMKPLELNVQDVKKLLRVAQIEVVKTKLLETGKIWIGYSDFLSVCNDSSLDPSQGGWISKMLEDSGNVIVLGNYVCLRPDQVTKSIEGLLPLPHILNPNDPRRKELKELETAKKIIDNKAHSLARRELWAGLGYLIIQATGLMRLTFWELSWDVMEPICFSATVIYFMAGYAFFLKTSKEPTFKRFYQSRFETKQKKLMKSQEFDVERYNQLNKLFNPNSSVNVSL